MSDTLMEFAGEFREVLPEDDAEGHQMLAKRLKKAKQDAEQAVLLYRALWNLHRIDERPCPWHCEGRKPFKVEG